MSLINLSSQVSSAFRSWVTGIEDGFEHDTLYLTHVSLAEESPSRGSCFADVYRGRWRGSVIALKRPRIFLAIDRDQLHEEISRKARRWQQLRHENVLQFYGISRDALAPFVCLTTPWIERGSVLSYLQTAKKGTVSNLKIANEVALGLKYLHSEDVVHGDLSANNVLVTDNGTAVIADFGQAPFADAVIATMTVSGHPGVRRMAPELHHPQRFGLQEFERTYQSDVYAFAMFCIELYTLSPPFIDIKKDTTVIFKVLEGCRPRFPTTEECPHDDLPNWLWDIIRLCWAQDANKRPTMREISDELWLDVKDYRC